MHLVTGATGDVGGRLLTRLIEAGRRVRMPARDPARLAGHLSWLALHPIHAAIPGSPVRCMAGPARSLAPVAIPGSAR